MTREVRAGNLSVNSNSPVRVQTSFGAMERSGCGPELGSEGSEGSEALASYAEVKNVFVATDR
jgi:acyl-CoA reductase-like NAD-dependent aldehyde dehydrogenase